MVRDQDPIAVGHEHFLFEEGRVACMNYKMNFLTLFEVTTVMYLIRFDAMNKEAVHSFQSHIEMHELGTGQNLMAMRDKLTDSWDFTEIGLFKRRETPLQSSQLFCKLLPVAPKNVLNASLIHFCTESLMSYDGEDNHFRYSAWEDGTKRTFLEDDNRE